jgi:hypothetical protein
MDDIRIDRLTFRVSGITEAQSRALAESVARDLAASGIDQVGAGLAGAALQVRATHRPGDDLRVLSRLIVNGVLAQLRRAT